MEKKEYPDQTRLHHWLDVLAYRTVEAGQQSLDSSELHGSRLPDAIMNAINALLPEKTAEASWRDIGEILITALEKVSPERIREYLLEFMREEGPELWDEVRTNRENLQRYTESKRQLDPSYRFTVSENADESEIKDWADVFVNRQQQWDTW